MLDSSARADIAVGYFFMSGFEAVSESLAGLRRVRILVGRTDKQVLEEVASGIQQEPALRAHIESEEMIRRSERESIARQAVDHVAEGVGMLPQNEGSQKAVRTLRDLIAAGLVEVRSYLRSPLHAKAYLCWYEGHAEKGSAVVGSSNMTLAGFSGNTELNVRVTGDAEMEALGEWFDNLWDESEDIADALVKELDESWPIAKTPPYHVYLKALYELYSDEIGAAQPPLPPRRPLANFQLDAVRGGLAMIEKYGGCYIGDVVGLGKTFIGAELLRQLVQIYPNEGYPLILCPAGLIPMWQRVNQEFQLGAQVISHSMITAPPNLEFDEELGDYIDAEAPQRGIILSEAYPHHGPVLVDEAHNFRNDNMRSRGLSDYLEKGDHKVVLLSATPQNLGPMDTYRQLRLFLDDTEHGLNIEPLNLEDYFRAAQRWLAFQADYENYQAELAAWESGGRRGDPPSEPTRSNVPRADIQELLQHVFIRRRRRDIRQDYEDAEIDGKPVRFPEPVLDNVEYRLDKVYEKAGPLDEINALLKAHKAYRYQGSKYVRKELRGREEYRDLFRAGDRIAGLMKALLFKRLESSIEAFRSTLNALIQSNRNFKEALEAGFVPIGNTATRILNGQSFEAANLLTVLREEEKRRQDTGQERSKLVHDVKDFRVNEWTRHLDEDYEILGEINERIRDIGPEDDDKLRVLREYLERPDVTSGKVLVFSEAETTIEYLYQQLNPGDADRTIARLTGSIGGDTANVVRRFSPGSNPAPGRLPGPEIRILLATDVVSEGQNLQDCARVLNYDLHWNPVKLIQRFGRVDRIGTEHAVINLNNMWPDQDVDAELDLTERLQKRVQSFHDLIGLDSKLLHESERVNLDAMYSIYAQGQMPEEDDGLDEVATNQRGAAILQRIRDNDPDLWQKVIGLPDGIRSALTVSLASEDTGSRALMPSPFDNPRSGETIVLVESAGVRACYAVDDHLVPRPISTAQFISAAECEPDTPTHPLPQKTNERVMAAFDAFSQEFRGRLGRARRPRDTQTRRYISRRLRICLDEADGDAEAIGQIETLRSIFLSEVPSVVEAALSDIKNLRISGDDLLRRLQALRERYRLNPQDDSQETTQPDVPIIRIVCSDGIV